MADLRFNVTAETRRATQNLGAFAQDVQKRLVNAVRALPNIELTADSTDAQREMKRIRDELAALANQRIGVDIDAADALAEMQRLQNDLRTLGGSTTEVGVRADVGQAERALGDIEAEVRQLSGADAEVEVTADTDQAESRLDGLLDGAKGAAAAAGVAAGAALSVGIATAMEFDQVDAKLRASFTGSAEYAGELGALAGQLYAQNYGASISEVGDALLAVLRSGAVFEDTTNEQLGSITAKVFSLAQAFDQDLNTAISAAGAMVKTGLAADADEALDIISRGFQQGADAGGDFLDTIAGSSATLAQFGFDGETAVGVMVQALNDGAPSAEFFIGALEELAGNAGDSADTFAELGLNGQQMARDLNAGGTVAQTALVRLMDAIRNIEDPAKRSTVLVGLFGEEATAMQEALLSIDPSSATDSLGEFAGTMAEVDAAIGDTAAAKVEKLNREFQLWTASIIETEGPLGTVAAGVSAFGPMALAALGAVAPLVLALKMGGVAAAVRGATGAVDEVGNAADRSERRTGKLGGVLKGLGAAAALGAIAVGVNEINIAAAGGEENLDGMAEGLNDMVDAGGQILSLDFGGIFADISDEWGQVVDQFETGQSVIGGVFAWFKREALGRYLEDITIDIGADPSGAREQIDQLLSDVNAWSGSVNINGNTNPAGFALRQILAEIAGGAETVLIDGEPMPALDALEYVKGLINAGAGEVTINGETMPAGEALSRFMGEVAATSGKVLIGADPAGALEDLTGTQNLINASIGTMTINGNRMPADQSLGAVLAAIDAGAAEVDINGTSVPAANALTTLISQIDAGAGTVEINGQALPAGQVLAALIQTISSSQGTSTINGQPSPAYNALNAFLSTGNRSVTTAQVDAETARANNQLNSLYVRWNGKVISLQASTAARMATGGVVSAASTRTYYASGGVDRPMRRMPVGVPAVAQPGMERVFGDASDVNESYIPWRKNSSTTRLLQITANALDHVVIPRQALGPEQARLASGGVVAPSGRVVWGSVSEAEWGRLRSLGWQGRAGDNVEALYAPGTGASSVGSRVATAMAQAPVAQARAAGVLAVADARVAAELAALRRDGAQANYGAATLRTLTSLLSAVQATGAAGRSALAEANAAGRRADGGAW